MISQNTQNYIDSLITDIPWFKNVGELDELILSPVKTEIQAMKFIQQRKWDYYTNTRQKRWFYHLDVAEQKNTEMEMANYYLSEFLSPITKNVVEQILTKYLPSQSANKNLIHHLTRDVTCFIKEQEFHDFAPNNYWIRELLPWYEKGHLPCGWDGDPLPDDWGGNISLPEPSGNLRIW